MSRSIISPLFSSAHIFIHVHSEGFLFLEVDLVISGRRMADVLQMSGRRSGRLWSAEFTSETLKVENISMKCS